MAYGSPVLFAFGPCVRGASSLEMSVRSRLQRRLTLALCAAIASIAGPTANAWQAAVDGKVRIFVEAAQPTPGGLVGPGHQRRVASAKDITRYFKSTIHVGLTARREEADVLVIVEGSAEESAGSETSVAVVIPNSGVAIGSSAADVLDTVRVRLKAGDYEAVLKAQAMTWTGAAQDIARQVAAWAKDNHAALIAGRSAAAAVK
jgi:hypothetical protein